MPAVIFSHPTVNHYIRNNRDANNNRLYQGRRPLYAPDGTLHIDIGPNQITWDYNLNTVTYPTYAGEVVQILSANIGDLTIGGDVPTYKMMEDIYLWFLVYLSLATQGFRNLNANQDGVISQNEQVVTMSYPVRNWLFQIRPKSLPGLRIGRDVVAPTWSMTAAVIEGDPEVEELSIQGALDGLTTLDAGIGYIEYNPFSTPSNADGYTSFAEDLEGYAKVLSRYTEQFSEHNFESVTSPFMADAPTFEDKENRPNANNQDEQE